MKLQDEVLTSLKLDFYTFSFFFLDLINSLDLLVSLVDDLLHRITEALFHTWSQLPVIKSNEFCQCCLEEPGVLHGFFQVASEKSPSPPVPATQLSPDGRCCWWK